MIVHYITLLSAVLLLWWPRVFLRFGKTVLQEQRPKPDSEDDPRKIRSPGDISVRFLEEITKPRNFLDLLRALAGAYLLLGTPAWDAAIMLPPRDPNVPVVPHMHPNAGLADKILMIQIGIFLVGVILQTLRYDGRRMLFPPIFYLTGIAFAVAGPQAAGFAIILGWLANRAVAVPTAFFFAFAFCLAGFGFVFDGPSRIVFATCALIMLPAVMSLLSSRPLIAMSRRVVAHVE